MKGGTDGRATHPVLGFARALGGALDRVQAVDPVLMTGAELRAALIELDKEDRRLAALRLRILAAADAAEVGADDGSTSTGAWLAHRTNADRPEAARAVQLARGLADQHAATAGELAQGAVSLEQARVIVRAIDPLPDDLDPALRAQAEKLMLEEAHDSEPSRLRIIGKHLVSVIAPDLVDELERAALERSERAAYGRSRLTLHANGDGSTDGWFRVSDLQAGMLRAALDAVTAARRLGQDRLDPETGRPLDRGALLGQGLCELIEHLPTDALGEHGGVAATMVVTISRESLETALGAAGLPGGDTISGGEARRLACTAGIIPAVLGGRSTSLDLGRESRLFSKAQRVAMGLRDKGCRAETCDRPASWCEAHHQNQPWSKGGRTDRADGVLLCGHHHRIAHHDGYAQRRLPNGDLRFTRRT